MVLDFVMLIAGLAVLAKFSDLTISNAVKFSYLTKINQMIVGFIIIAVSTSLPEFSIAILSSARGEGLISLGNVIGANVANIALIFGIISLVGFRMKKRDAVRANLAATMTTILVIFMLVLRKIDYIFAIFLLLMFYVFSKAIITDGIKVKQRSRGLRSVESVKALFYLLVSIAFVIISASVVTDSAVSISINLGIAESVIGATILSIGTTMPELSIGLTALKRRNVELAIGDTVGSIITNLTLVLGTAALINPIAIGGVEIVGLVLLTIVNMIFLLMSTRGIFRKREGMFLLGVYAAYIGLMLFAGTVH